MDYMLQRFMDAIAYSKQQSRTIALQHWWGKQFHSTKLDWWTPNTICSTSNRHFLDTFQSSWQFHWLTHTDFTHVWKFELQRFPISAVDVIHWDSGLRLCKKSSKIFKSVRTFPVGVHDVVFSCDFCESDLGSMVVGLEGDVVRVY